jgi:hypothetical protein
VAAPENLEVVGYKHLKGSGHRRRTVTRINRANATLWLGRATHPADGSAISMSVEDTLVSETEQPFLRVELMSVAQQWVDTYPGGDPAIGKGV